MEIYNTTLQRLEKESRKTGPPSSTHRAPSITPNSSVSWNLRSSTNESSSSRSSATSSARSSPTPFSNVDTNPVNQDPTSSKNDKIDNSEPPCVSSSAFESSNASSTSKSGRASPTSSASSVYSSETFSYAQGLINLSATNSNVSGSASGDSVPKADNSTDGESRESAIEDFRAESFTSNDKKEGSPWTGCSAHFRQGDPLLRTSAKASALVMASRTVVQKSGERPRSGKRFPPGTQSSTPSEPKSNTASPSGGKFRWEDHYNISRKTNLQYKSRSQDTGLQRTRGVVPSARFLVKHNPFTSSSSSEASLSSDKSKDTSDSSTYKKHIKKRRRRSV
mmetsp:Transcript_25324/g.35513  ORF Transcript_25324/g.35513 Transcript_25324/m.35513 type:complete len:336 (-) Transcript_25324:313-1320(-)